MRIYFMGRVLSSEHIWFESFNSYEGVKGLR